MAHRSKKKHLKHVHEHEPATPPAKSPVEKAEAAAAGIARKSPTKRRALEPKAAAPKPPRAARPVKKKTKKGLVRRIAKATDTLVAKLPRPSELADRATERIAGRLPRTRKLARKARHAIEDRLPSAGELADKLPRASKVAARPRKAIARAKARVKQRVSRVRSMLAAA